jgi:pimeloyl-ACP methyl ester carboxylesterase
MKSIAGLFALALSLWGLACAGYYLGQDRLIFLGAPPVAPDAPARDVRFEVDGASLAGWLINPEAAVNVVYFGGNAEAIAAHAQRFASIADARTLLVDYRGYGRSTGAPSERALVDDAVRYVPALTDPDKPLLLVGRSLGSGVAALAAAQLGSRVDALLLVSPFCSFRNVVARHAPAWLPASILLEHPFDVASVAAGLPRRLRVVIAGDDDIIVPGESRCLTDRLGLSPDLVIELPGRGHNDVFDGVWPALRAAIASAAAGAPPHRAPRAVPSRSPASSRG